MAGFCRTLPYAGTPLKRQLEAEGRLLGTPFEPDYAFLDPKLDRFYDWMLLTFQKRNFTNDGLCEVLRSFLFEARLNLPGRRLFTPGELARLTSITAQANGHALYCLKAALDYVEATPLAKIQINAGFLAALTAHERAHEQRLLAEAHELYWSVRQRQGFSPSHEPVDERGPGGLGGFENSWTVAPRDLISARA
jgi:hypothetical protein